LHLLGLNLLTQKTVINFDQDYILENDSVLLRPLKMEDFDYLKNFSLNEPDLWIHSLQRADGLEKFEKYMQTAVKGRLDQNAYAFIVFDKLTNQYAGSTRFYDIQPHHQSTQLGYTWYGKAFQGTGLNKNCKYLLLQLAFDEWQMKRVEFRASSENQRSINAMISIGCKVEGTLRDHLVAENGIRRSSIVLSILENEWRTSVKENLLNKIK
jgi:RimJ/RimL family protein N-acetyltransferase